MHSRFIQQGRVDTVWTVLGAFGYGEDLEIKEEVLRPKSVHIICQPKIDWTTDLDLALVVSV